MQNSHRSQSGSQGGLKAPKRSLTRRRWSISVLYDVPMEVPPPIFDATGRAGTLEDFFQDLHLRILRFRKPYNQQTQQNLQANNGTNADYQRMSNATPASIPNTAMTMHQPVQQQPLSSSTPQSATTATQEQAEAAQIGPAAQSSYKQEAQ